MILDDVPKLSSSEILHHKVEHFGALEERIEFRDSRMSQLSHDGSLIEDLVDFIHFFKELLLELLDGHDLTAFFLLRQDHFSIASSSKGSNDLVAID